MSPLRYLVISLFFFLPYPFLSPLSSPLLSSPLIFHPSYVSTSFIPCLFHQVFPRIVVIETGYPRSPSLVPSVSTWTGMSRTKGMGETDDGKDRRVKNGEEEEVVVKVKVRMMLKRRRMWEGERGNDVRKGTKENMNKGWRRRGEGKQKKRKSMWSAGGRGEGG